MKTNSKYEEKILTELRDIPPSSLPKVLKLIHLVKEEFLAAEGEGNQKSIQEGKQILLALGKGLGEML